MINIPIALFITLIIFGFIGLVHIIIYIVIFIGGLAVKKYNDSEIKCPYYVEAPENDK